MPSGGDDGLDAERCCRAQDRADIVRIGDLVEHQHDAVLRQFVEMQAGQGIGLHKQSLMHGVRPEAAIDVARIHQFRRNAGVDLLVREPPGHVFGDEQLADAALGIGQRHGDGVPAIKNDRTFALCMPPAASLVVSPVVSLGLAISPARTSALRLAVRFPLTVSWVASLALLVTVAAASACFGAFET